MTKEQIELMTKEQIELMTKEQIELMTKVQIELMTKEQIELMTKVSELLYILTFLIIPPATKLQGGILVSPCPSVHPQTNPMSYDNLSCISQNLLKFYQLFTGEERMIPFIFDDFQFCRSRVIGLDMTENRIFTLCRMIT